jgi:voltage-gated potassium channel
VTRPAPVLAHGPLRRRSSWPPAASLALRAALALALVSVALAGHWLDRGGLRDNVDGQVSFPDVLYFTMVTVTTVGYGDIVPVTDRARMFDTFVVTPVRLFVWLIFLGTAYDFFLRKTWDRWRMAFIQRNLHGHVVIAGMGRSGAEALRELIARGTDPRSVVVVDESEGALAAAESLGVATMQGDATRDETLAAAQVARAQALIVAAGRDDTSILIVLTARGLAPDVPISVAIRAEDNEVLAHRAGATTVINPVSFTGLLLAGSTHGQHIADYITDLASTSGRVSLRERCVEPGEVGRCAREIGTGMVVRIYRNGTPHGFWEVEAERLAAGDTIVEIVPGSGGRRG